MAAKRLRWSAVDYKNAVKGATDAYGLRAVAHGFAAADGFDMRSPNSWTPAQKRKVRIKSDQLRVLTAQPTRPIHLRNPDHFQRAWSMYHGEISPRGFKVVLVPDYSETGSHVDTETGEITSRRPPLKLRFPKGTDAVEIITPNYTNTWRPFNQKALVKDPAKEVRRVAAEMPDARMFFVAIGQRRETIMQSVIAHGIEEPGGMIDTIVGLMNKYDGHKKLTGSNANDNPRHHYWKDWLKGMYGYILPSGMSRRKLEMLIHKRRAEYKALKKARRPKRRRK